MKRNILGAALGSIVSMALLVSLVGCYPTEEEELAEQTRLSQQCRAAGGRYVLTIPPGYTSAHYWCLWDEEKEGGEW